MKCIYAYTPAQHDAQIVPYVNISEDEKGDFVITVRQKGEQKPSVMAIPSAEAYKMAFALGQQF